MVYLKTIILRVLALFILLNPNGAICSNTLDDSRRIIILLGPTGSGKGTQAALLSKEYNLPHISTGDLYREEVKSTSSLAALIKHHESTSKHFIPQEMMIGMLMKRLLQSDCKKGFILDGFPRSLSRAEILKTYIVRPEDKVYLFVLNIKDHKILKDRLSKRLICPKCHQQYNTNVISKNTCEKCGISLVRRSDDTDEKFLIKLKMYNEQNRKITSFLKDDVCVTYINIGENTPPTLIHNHIKTTLDQ